MLWLAGGFSAEAAHRFLDFLRTTVEVLHNVFFRQPDYAPAVSLQERVFRRIFCQLDFARVGFLVVALNGKYSFNEKNSENDALPPTTLCNGVFGRSFYS